jgi:lipopolysaccharide export system protein LptA
MKQLWLLLLSASLSLRIYAQTDLSATMPQILAPPLETNETASVRPPEEIVITSDLLQGNSISNIFIYSGNVRITDEPQLKLTSDSFTAEIPKVVSNKFYRATAEGNVIIDFVRGGVMNHATADKFIYTYSITNGITNAVAEFRALTNSHVIITNTQKDVFIANPILWNRITGEIKAWNVIQRHIVGTNVSEMFGPSGQQPKSNPRK